MTKKQKSRSSLPTIKDVARIANVSLGSVSRVVNGNPTVSPRVKRQVLAAIKELGYTPNVAAQTMRSQVSKTVACIIRDISLPGFTDFVRAAHDELFEAGYALLLSNSDNQGAREQNLVSILAARNAGGLLISHSSENNPELEMLMLNSNIPVVLIDRERPEWADAVMVDHRNGIRRATERLLRLGHRRIALLTGHDDLYPARERIAGFRKAHEDAGIPVVPSLIKTGGFIATFGFEQTSLLMAQPDHPTALIAGGIDMLPGVIRALRVRNLSIPDDVSLIGAHSSYLTELHDPTITVETWDYGEVGRIAARFLLERMRSENDGPPQRIVIPTEVLWTDSCASPRGNA